MPEHAQLLLSGSASKRHEEQGGRSQRRVMAEESDADAEDCPTCSLVNIDDLKGKDKKRIN